MGYLDSIAMAKHYHRAYQYDSDMLLRITGQLDDAKQRVEADKQYLDSSYQADQKAIQDAYSGKLYDVEQALKDAYKENNTAKINRLTAERDKLMREERLALSELERKKNDTANRYQLSKNPLEAALERKKEYWNTQKEYDKGAWDQAKQSAEDAKKSLFSGGGG